MSSNALFRAVAAGPINAAVTTAQLFPNKQTPAVPITVPWLGTGRLEQKKGVIRATGSVTTGATSNVTVTLYIAKVIPGTPFTASNWAVLAASTARSVASATCAWQIEAAIDVESVGGTMQGTFTTLINNLADAAAPITNPLTGLNATTETVTQTGPVTVPAQEPVFFVAVGITFGTANAGNLAVLGDFCLDG